MSSVPIKEIRPHSVKVSARTVWTFVQLTDADGRTGFGETSGVDIDIFEAQIRAYANVLVGLPTEAGCDATAIHDLRRATYTRSRSAIDQAAWDLRAQQQGVVLATLFGVPKRNTVRTYANLNRSLVMRDPPEFGRRAAQARADGFEAVKIAPFDDVSPALCTSAHGRDLIEAGLMRVAAVREAIGNEIDLLIDCHWRFDFTTAMTVIERLAQFGVAWVECPLPELPETLASISQLRRHAHSVGARLAGGDEIADPEFFREVIASDTYDVVMPDLKYLGGLVEALHLAALAERAGSVCSFHNQSGPVAHLHSVHASTLIESDLYLEHQYAESPLFARIMKGCAVIPTAGRATLPEAPGLGAKLDLSSVSGQQSGILN